MEWLQSLCKGNRDFVTMLRSPVIKSDTKGKIVKAVAQNNIGLLTNTFIQLLINKGRESALRRSQLHLFISTKRSKNISCKLTTAYPLSDDLKKHLLIISMQQTNAEYRTGNCSKRRYHWRLYFTDRR